MKKLIKDYIKLPSEAVQLMIDGLKEEREGFEVNMETFGRAEQGGGIIFCTGCAATRALEKLAGVAFKPSNIFSREDRAEAAGFDYLDVDNFENAIDFLRMGNILNFQRHLNMVLDASFNLPQPEVYFSLKSYNWRTELPKVEAYAELLRSQGL